MPKLPIDMTQHPEFLRRQRELQTARQHQSELHADLGRQAFHAIREYRGKLKPKDREAIARNICAEVERYYASYPDEERYQLLLDAGITKEKSTKALARLMLKPGASAKSIDGLYAQFEKYRWLIETIARRTGECMDALASRVLFGTSFYPQRPDIPAPSINEAHLILAALQAAVDRVDAEFHLFDQCRQVARLRHEVEESYWDHLEKKGAELDYETWKCMYPTLVVPQADWPQTYPANADRFAHENGLWWPLEDWHLFDEKDNLVVSIVPANAYWAKNDAPADPFSSRILSGPDFFFFPHIYLGPAITPNGYFGDGPKDQLRELPMPHANWDESTHTYSLRQPEYLRNGSPTTEFDGNELSQVAARWLVIYPDPLMKKLVPMIYALGEVPGAELFQLTAPQIADFGNPDSWQYFGKNTDTLLRRLKDLTGYHTGEFKVYAAWRETAARFHWNPILRKHPEVIDEITYRRHLERWVSQGRQGAGEGDEVD